MADLVPFGLPDTGNARQLARAVQAQEKTELAIYQHHLEARYLAEIDRIDSQAISDVAKAALEEEMNTLDWGLGQAAGSQAKAELVSRMVSLQSKIDSARIARRFGG
jgi:hypothetical protein